MELETTVYTGVILFSAYLMRGIAGFGSALIAVPLLALMFPLTLVVPLVVLLDYLGSATQGFRNRQRIVWGDLAPLIPFTIIGVATSLMLLNAVNSKLLSNVLGGFVILYAIYQISPLPVLRGSRILSIPYGFLGGLVGTLFGTGGPFYVIYLNLRGLDKSAFRATFAMYFLVDGAMRLTGYAVVGFFDHQMLMALLASIPIAGIALFIGGRVHTTISQQTFAKLISLLLVTSGSALLLKG